MGYENIIRVMQILFQNICLKTKKSRHSNMLTNNVISTKYETSCGWIGSKFGKFVLFGLHHRLEAWFCLSVDLFACWHVNQQINRSTL